MFISFLLGMSIAAIIFSILFSIYYYRAQNTKVKQIRKERDSAITASRRVLKGQLAEQMFPALQQDFYGYALGDMTFIGKLFDYVIVDGYTAAKDEDGEIRKVIFIDVKTGNAKLSSHQEKLKKAIEDGRVEWKTITITDSGKLKEK